MRHRTLAAGALLALGLAQPAAARDPLVLEPSSNWELDYAEDSCALRRMFGEGEQQTRLEMHRFQPGTRLQVTVASKARMIRRSIRIRFGDEGEWVRLERPLFAYFDDGFEGLIFLHSLFRLPLDEDAEPEELTRFHVENDVAAMEAVAAAKFDSLTVFSRI